MANNTSHSGHPSDLLSQEIDPAVTPHPRHSRTHSPSSAPKSHTTSHKSLPSQSTLSPCAFPPPIRLTPPPSPCSHRPLYRSSPPISPLIHSSPHIYHPYPLFLSRDNREPPTPPSNLGTTRVRSMSPRLFFPDSPHESLSPSVSPKSSQDSPSWSSPSDESSLSPHSKLDLSPLGSDEQTSSTKNKPATCKNQPLFFPCVDTSEDYFSSQSSDTSESKRENYGTYLMPEKSNLQSLSHMTRSTPELHGIKLLPPPKPPRRSQLNVSDHEINSKLKVKKYSYPSATSSNQRRCQRNFGSENDLRMMTHDGGVQRNNEDEIKSRDKHRNYPCMGHIKGDASLPPRSPGRRRKLPIISPHFPWRRGSTDRSFSSTEDISASSEDIFLDKSRTADEEKKKDSYGESVGKTSSDIQAKDLRRSSVEEFINSNKRRGSSPCLSGNEADSGGVRAASHQDQEHNKISKKKRGEQMQTSKRKISSSKLGTARKHLRHLMKKILDKKGAGDDGEGRSTSTSSNIPTAEVPLKKDVHRQSSCPGYTQNVTECVERKTSVPNLEFTNRLKMDEDEDEYLKTPKGLNTKNRGKWVLTRQKSISEIQNLDEISQNATETTISPLIRRMVAKESGKYEGE